MYSEEFLRSLRARLESDPVVEAPPGDRLAGVLVPLIENGTAGPSIVFTKRNEDMSRHPGEISFPGGIRHDDDETLAATALREMHEELGVPPDAVEVLGALAPVHTHVSGTLVVPFVGFLPGHPVFTPNVAEVAEVIEAPIEEILDAERLVEMERGGIRFQTYVYETGGHIIWGATGYMLHQFVSIVKEEGVWPAQN